MDKPIFFCKTWSVPYKDARNIYTPEEARAAHEKGEILTVLVGDVKQPSCAIEYGLADDGKLFYAVKFLDGRLRNYLTYVFDQVADDKLFLTMVSFRLYAGDTDKVEEGHATVFEESGLCHHSRTVYTKPPREETWDTRAPVPHNYAPIPRFGEYDEIIRTERDLA
jgi:hypothetical protein